MGFGDDLSGAWNTITHDAGQVVNAVTSAVGDLANLGISCPEYVIKLFLDEGWDAVQEISTLYHEITSAGHDCVAFFDQLVAGCEQHGSPRAYLTRLAQGQMEQILPDLEQMVNVWGRSAQPPMDMLNEIDALLKQHPGFGAATGSQGAMASTFVARYQEVRANISQMAAPMASSPSSPWDGKDYGRDLQNIWNEFTNECSTQLSRDMSDGTMGIRLVGVVLCIAAIVFADAILATVAVAAAGFSGGLSVPAGAGVIAVWDIAWVCLAMECLGLLVPFVKMLLEIIGMLVDMIIVAPLAYVWHEIELGLTYAAALTAAEIKDLAQIFGVGEEVIREWERMGLSPEQMLEAAALLAAGLSVYDAGNLAKTLTPAQIAVVLVALPAYLGLLCGGILGISDILIALVQQGVNLFDITAAKGANALFKKLADLAQIAKSADRTAALGAQRVLGILNKIGLQNVQDIDDPLQSGGKGADITLKGDPPVGVEVGGPSKTANDAQYQDYIDEYGKGNVRVYIQDDDGAGAQAIKEAEGKVGKGNVQGFTKDELKCAS